MSRISTYSGGGFDVLNPKAADVRLMDIAHALSMNCRYNGHTCAFYSVAEHSVVASVHGAQEHAIHLLMHDAGEAYLTDMPRPIKEAIGHDFEVLEAEVMAAIYEAMDLPPVGEAGRAAIREADLRMLATEKAQLLPNCTVDWPILENVAPYYEWRDGEPRTPKSQVRLSCWNHLHARDFFLHRFATLTGRTMNDLY